MVRFSHLYKALYDSLRSTSVHVDATGYSVHPCVNAAFLGASAKVSVRTPLTTRIRRSSSQQLTDFYYSLGFLYEFTDSLSTYLYN